LIPTDNLESTKRDRFNGQKFFCSSLGNTLVIEKEILDQIASIVTKNEINEITFSLSESNRIVLDALSNQHYSDIKGLNEAYNHILPHQKDVKNSWDLNNQHAMILSYHLNDKINEINGILFSKFYNGFRQIHPELICINSNILN